MKKSLRIWSLFIIMLFLSPILMKFLPISTETSTNSILNESRKIVYAANVFENDRLSDFTNQKPNKQKEHKKNTSKKSTKSTDASVLLYFTHNHEAYSPITKEKNGKVAVSHHEENIEKFGGKLSKQLANHQVHTQILDVDNMAVQAERERPFSQAYHTIRSFVENQLKKEHYDLVIDLHRDSIGRKHTTVQANGVSYAKVAFVVGLEHQEYQKNEAQAVALQNAMEQQVPGITRPLIRKSGKGVDGKYNQDLHPQLLLIELGGMENNEEELNRTVAVLAESISIVLAK